MYVLHLNQRFSRAYEVNAQLSPMSFNQWCHERGVSMYVSVWLHFQSVFDLVSKYSR